MSMSKTGVGRSEKERRIHSRPYALDDATALTKKNNATHGREQEFSAASDKRKKG